MNCSLYKPTTDPRCGSKWGESMKYIIFSLVALAFSQPAFSSDRFVAEIVCSAVRAPGEADNGLDVVVRTNPTAWVKQIQIIENGYLGPRVIGSFHVTVDQPRVTAPGYFDGARIATYETDGLTLVMEVKDSKGQEPKGLGHVRVLLPKYHPIEAELSCQKAVFN